MQEQTLPTIRQRMRRMSVFDGQDLKRAILAGAAHLEAHREAINALNVFPVPDGDTGSNMSATMQAVVRDIIDSTETSAGVVAARVAHAALLGARGNSGVILSQALRGIAQGLDKKATFTALDVAIALQHASQLAYHAVMKPVEGTILTVVREAAEAAQRSAERGDHLVGLVREVATAARQAVIRTPDLLPTLKQAGVVDSGGQGFYILLEGILHHIHGEVGTPSTVEGLPARVKKGHVTIEEEFGYEVVFLLRGTKLDIESVRQTIVDMGGVSTVVAGDEKMLKVHTHTLTPGKILDYGVSLGSLLDINIENLQEQSLTYAAQSEAEHTAETPITQASTHQLATVAVVSGAGFEKVFQGLGVNAIVSGGQTMNPSTEELLVAVEATPAHQVILLPNNRNVILSAQQVVGLTKKEVYVLPSSTMPQGIAALQHFNFEADFATNCEIMTAAAKSIQTAEITLAVRSVQIDNVQVHKGDYIGLVNGKLVSAAQHIEASINDVLQRMNIDNYEIVTLYYGQDVTAQEAQDTATRIKREHPHLELEVVDGTQAHYAYIFSAE